MNLRNRRLPTGQWLAFGLLLILSVGMMGGSNTRPVRTLVDDVNYMLNPVEIWLNGVGDTLSSYIHTLANLDNVASENERLKAEVQKLQEELGRMPAVSRLNDDWTRISQAQQTSPYQTTIASVVMRDISDVREKTIVINRGRVDGMSVGQVVIDEGGALVGRIRTVNNYDSTIRLVNDYASVVIGAEAETGAIGTLTGQVGGLLNMQYVASNEELIKGHTVVTAGLVSPGSSVTSPYPKGLLIGTIVTVSTDPNQSFRSATVQPAANLDNLDWVLVIMNYKGGFPSASPTTSGGALPTATPTPGASGGATPKPSPVQTPTPQTTPGPTPIPTPTPTPPPGIVTPPPH